MERGSRVQPEEEIKIGQKMDETETDEIEHDEKGAEMWLPFGRDYTEKEKDKLISKVIMIAVEA